MKAFQALQRLTVLRRTVTNLVHLQDTVRVLLTGQAH